MKMLVIQPKNWQNNLPVVKKLLTLCDWKVQTLDAWNPHALSKNNKLYRSKIAAGLLARNKSAHGCKDRILYCIITDDESCLCKY